MPDQKPRTRRRRPPAADITSDTPIWCPWCEAEHPASSFNRESRRFSGLSVICRVAQAQKRRTPEEQERTRQRNLRRWQDPAYRERGLAAAVERRRTKGPEDLRKSRARLQRIVDEWKATGCVDCGYDDTRAIDPDHRDGEVKVGHLSRLVTLCASADRIRAELSKCDPRCARCHRRRTQQQRFAKARRADRLPPSWQRRIDMQDENDAIKLDRGCADCGWKAWPRGLDWDHVSGQKVASIAVLIGKIRPWPEVLEEMAKCEVVCANCHRIRTWNRRRSNANPAVFAR